MDKIKAGNYQSLIITLVKPNNVLCYVQYNSRRYDASLLIEILLLQITDWMNKVGNTMSSYYKMKNHPLSTVKRLNCSRPGDVVAGLALISVSADATHARSATNGQLYLSAPLHEPLCQTPEKYWPCYYTVPQHVPIGNSYQDVIA
ncbi:hypothetical protein ACQKDS_17205 [Serratia sp. NPDC078593]|uniref:hypothetical protein n=1 Tax=unclassified Serratia (in: enterobacteria) TaxID=2647522 RepID=UPI0037D0D36D